MNFLYRIHATAKHGHQHINSSPTDLLGVALEESGRLRDSGHYHTIMITRADQSGVNAGKYYLHQIVK